MEFDVVGTVRTVRRIADLSQRELARKANVSHSTVARIEAGTVLPSLAMLDRLLAVAGLELAIVDHEYRLGLPMLDRDDMRDGAERRYPSHLDVILDPRPGEWWGSRYGSPGRPRRSTGTAPGGTTSAGSASGTSGSPRCATCRTRGSTAAEIALQP